MKINFELTCQRKPGTLLRVLGLVERRGYEAISMTATAHSPDEYQVALQLRVDVPTPRDPDNLRLQLNKLYDVISIQEV